MLVLPAGTEVKLLRTSDPSAFQVRILSGQHEGQKVWMRRSQYENKGPDERPFPPLIGEPQTPEEGAGAPPAPQ
jgi:hypothetical protein